MTDSADGGPRPGTRTETTYQSSRKGIVRSCPNCSHTLVGDPDADCPNCGAEADDQQEFVTDGGFPPGSPGLPRQLERNDRDLDIDPEPRSGPFARCDGESDDDTDATDSVTVDVETLRRIAALLDALEETDDVDEPTDVEINADGTVSLRWEVAGGE